MMLPLLLTLAAGNVVRGREHLFQTQLEPASLEDASFEEDATLASVLDEEEVDAAPAASVAASGFVRSETFEAEDAALVETEAASSASAGKAFKWRLSKWDSHLQAKGKKIGRGSFGAVIQGTLDCSRSRTNVQQVAVKVLNVKEGDVKSEVQAMKIFTSENFVRLFSHGKGPVTNGYAIMMEKCDSDLSNHFPRNFKGVGDVATVEESLRMTVDILRGLKELHEYGSGLVHRDLKPDNVLVKCTGRSRTTCHAKIADLGLACAKESRQALRDGMATCSCGRGCPGTPIYMAPETVDRRPTQAASSDNFAVGLILYEFVFAHRPPTFDAARTIADLNKAILGFSFDGVNRNGAWTSAPRHWREYFATATGARFQSLLIALLGPAAGRSNTATLLSQAEALHEAEVARQGLTVAANEVEYVDECVCRSARFRAVACREPARPAPAAEKPVAVRPRARDSDPVVGRHREPRQEQVYADALERIRRAGRGRPDSAQDDVVLGVHDHDEGPADDVERSAAVSAADELEGDDFITIKNVVYHNGLQVAAVIDAAKHQAGVDNYSRNEPNILDCRTQDNQGVQKRKWLPPALRNSCWRIMAIQGNDIIADASAEWIKKQDKIKNGVHGADVTVQIREVTCMNTPQQLKACEEKAKATPLGRKPRGRRW